MYRKSTVNIYGDTRLKNTEFKGSDPLSQLSYFIIINNVCLLLVIVYKL